MLTDIEATSAQLQAAYQAGQREFQGIELVGDGEFPSLSNADFHGAKFIKSWFHSVSFVNVDLSLVTFTDCNLKCSTFENCKLQGSKWEGCLVCAIEFANSDTKNIQAGHLEAYGASIDGTREFLEYAIRNVK